MSLLDKALEKKRPAAKVAEYTAEELELAVAMFHGRVTSQQAAHALGRENGLAVGAWAMKVVQLALADGACSLVIGEAKAAAGEDEDEDEDAEFDKQHEKAKASPLSSLGKTARR